MKLRPRRSLPVPDQQTMASPERVKPLGGLKPMRILTTLGPLRPKSRRVTIPLAGIGLVVMLSASVWFLSGAEPASGPEDFPGLAAVAPGAGPTGGPDKAGERAPDFLSIAARELEARGAALAAREREVAVREEALRALTVALRRELAELRALQSAQDEEQERLAREQEERSVRLARLYESMKPKKAASILDGMPPEDAAGIARRMRDDKAAAVIQQMAPEQATALSDLLAKP